MRGECNCDIGLCECKIAQKVGRSFMVVLVSVILTCASTLNTRLWVCSYCELSQVKRTHSRTGGLLCWRGHPKWNLCMQLVQLPLQFHCRRSHGNLPGCGTWAKHFIPLPSFPHSLTHPLTHSLPPSLIYSLTPYLPPWQQTICDENRDCARCTKNMRTDQNCSLCNTVIVDDQDKAERNSSTIDLNLMWHTQQEQTHLTSYNCLSIDLVIHT